MKYFVLKGFHFSNFLPWFHKIKEHIDIAQEIVFDQSCAYSIVEKSCVNKLFGFCYGFGVHRNSIRFGWSYNNGIGDIIIWKYVYQNGKLIKQRFANVTMNYPHTFEIKTTVNGDTSRATFFIDGIYYGYEDVPVDSCFYTTLGFYFGGNTRAPHTLFIKKLN